METKVTSEEIIRALAKKHATEFFLTEVKNGSTYFTHGLRMIDALAIYKSWAHQRIVAYEIKVSRGDFLGDAKMTQYLKYCHELYLVCPQGMIQGTELPIEIGLMWYNKTTGKITTRRKAVWNNIEVDADMLYYIIMYRLQNDRIPFHSDKLEFFNEWIENKDKNHLIGRRIGTKMAMEIERLQDDLDKYSGVKANVQLMQDIHQVMRKHGIRCWQDERLPAELDKALDKTWPDCLDTVVIQLEAALNTIKAGIAKEGGE